MAQSFVEHERKSRKRQSSKTQKTLHTMPIMPGAFPQDFSTPSLVNTSLTCVASAQEMDYPHSKVPPPVPKKPWKKPSPHPIYGYIPQSTTHGGQYQKSQIPPSGISFASQTTVRLASPQRHPSKEEGPFQQQWDKFDRIAAKSCSNLREGAMQSVTKLTTNYVERPTAAVAQKTMQTLCRGASLCDVISSKFDSVVSCIDDQKFSGKEQDLMIYDDEEEQAYLPQKPARPSKGRESRVTHNLHAPPQGKRGSNYFSKVWLYSNSRLPPHVPPFKVYMPTYPLLCLAATYSEKAYSRPSSKSSIDAETHIEADWKTGTKAMVLKAIPVEELNTVVFAIRGSQNFMDWAVNYNSSPSSPKDFLDDPSNLCHAGFLYVARRMIKPVADRLRVLLQENPARSNCSLLITGHSAGGAVAALLYAHMMNKNVKSDLSYLTGFFKRVHCITFGAPPVSLRPLKKPEDKRHRKSLFYSFINEGDPIPRADKGVMKSLLRLYAAPAPSTPAIGATSPPTSKAKVSPAISSSPPKSRFRSSFMPKFRTSRTSLQSTNTAYTNTTSTSSMQTKWDIPECTLAPAGRLVVLRQVPGSRNENDVEAVTVDEKMLSKVVYGDVMKHQMKTYKSRIDWVATKAVTANGC